MNIFIRADGGKNIGLGHIMRMCVLGKELKKRNNVIFICKDCEKDTYIAGHKILKDNNFDIIFISDDNIIENIINVQKKYNFDMLITDSYDVDEKYFFELKPYFKKCGYVDDINKCYMDVDFIINQNINAHTLEYVKNLSNKTKLFLGTKFCMLREEFREAYNKKQVNNYVQNVLLTVGGMDKDYNTIKLLKVLSKFNVTIHVVIGSAFESELIKEINDEAYMNKNIKCYENAVMSELMLKCDIAVAACGSTLYELAAMCVPTIGIIIADNQINVGLIMKDKGLISDIFRINAIDEEKLELSINKLIHNEPIRQNIINNQKNNININGAVELAQEIENLK